MINRDVLDPKEKMRDIMGYRLKDFVIQMLPILAVIAIGMFITYQYAL